MPRPLSGRKPPMQRTGRTAAAVKKKKRTKIPARKLSPRQIQVSLLRDFNAISSLYKKLCRAAADVQIGKNPPSADRVREINSGFIRLKNLSTRFYNLLLKYEKILGKNGVLEFVHSFHHFIGAPLQDLQYVKKKFPDAGFLELDGLETLYDIVRKYK